MNIPIELPLENDDRLADPPLLDTFKYEPDRKGYSVGFVPSRGTEFLEQVFITGDSPEGRRISALILEINRLVSGSLDRAIHSGGGDYTLYLGNGLVVSLSDGILDQARVHEIFDRLKQIADAAEVAFNPTFALRHHERRF